MGLPDHHLLATFFQVVDKPFVREKGLLLFFLLKVLTKHLFLLLGPVEQVIEDMADADGTKQEVELFLLVFLELLLDGRVENVGGLAVGLVKVVIILVTFLHLCSEGFRKIRVQLLNFLQFEAAFMVELLESVFSSGLLDDVFLFLIDKIMVVEESFEGDTLFFAVFFAEETWIHQRLVEFSQEKEVVFDQVVGNHNYFGRADSFLLQDGKVADDVPEEIHLLELSSQNLVFLLEGSIIRVTDS